MMRDDPMDAPIPDEFQPSTEYYDKSEADARAQLLKLERMTPDEFNREARAERDAGMKSWQERRERRKAERVRYESMIAKVEAWTPPSAEHVGLKEFMVKQLRESIEFDCSEKYDDPPKFRTGEEWRVEKIKSCRHDIEYALQHRKEEIERTAGRNLWIRQLRESLK